MMFGELEALERRAVACKHWCWMPGMLTANISTGQLVRITEYNGPINSVDILPELTDSATLGCFLAVVREAWNDPTASVWFDDTKYGDGQMWMWRAGDKGRCMYDTEAAALVEALEAAP